MADPLTMAGTAFGLAKGVWPFIKRIFGRGNTKETGQVTTQTGSGIANTFGGRDATSATDISGIVVEGSPGAQIYVGHQPVQPGPVTGSDRTASPAAPPDVFRWEGRPASLADHFVGRQADVDKVAEAMKGSNAVVISGGAGLGKSRLAAEYTHQSGGGGFWTSAGGTAAQTLAALVPRLGIDTKGLNGEEIAAEAGRAVAALPPDLVWVIDNLPDFGQLNDLLAVAGPVKLLVTTRDSREYLKPSAVAFLTLGELEPEAAVELLHSRGADTTNEEVLKEIADIVGYLPMALEMLAARLGEPLADAGSVLAELKEAPNTLLVKAFQDAAGQDLGKPVGVYSAITGTLNGLTPETRKAISPFGYLTDEPVPLPLASAITGLDTNGLGQLLAECAGQSILSVSQDQLVVHALTAAAIAATNGPDALGRAISSAFPRIAAICEHDPVVMRAEVAHYDALHAHAKKHKISEGPMTLGFSGCLVVGYSSLGRTEESVKLGEETLEAQVRVLGPEDPGTLAGRENLAGGYMSLGRTEEAVKLVEETLEARVKLLGLEHPDTLSSRNNLAIGYDELGRTEESVKLDEETLETRIRLLGMEHPDTLASRSNLAIGYGKLGRAEESVKLEEETLEARTRVQGPEHPNTLTSRSNLAIGYRELGRTEEAVKLDEETLEARVRVLGAEHPNTLTSRNNLAIGYRELGRTEEAVKLDEETLEAKVRVLGPEHPDTLTSRSNLAIGYRALGRTEKAVKLDEETLEVRVRVLGPEHPDTLGSRSNLAIGYRALGRTEEAMKLNQETLEARVTVLGPEHPDTLSSRSNLIISYRAAGREADADALAADGRFPADA